MTMKAKRLEALRKGEITYDPGKPCKYGHDSPRYAKEGRCVVCSKYASKRAYQDMVDAMNEWEGRQ